MSRHLDRWVEPLLLVTIAVGIFVDSLSYPPTVVPGAPGPTFFPRLLAMILVAGAGFLTWRPPGTARRPHEEPELSALEPEASSAARLWISGRGELSSKAQ